MFPTLSLALSSRGTALFASTRLPSMTCSGAAIAESADAESEKVTNPKPRDLRVLGSRMTTASDTGPNFLKKARSFSSVVSKDNPPMNNFLNRWKSHEGVEVRDDRRVFFFSQKNHLHSHVVSFEIMTSTQ